MPVNAGPEYFLAERRYLQAKTKEEKITALEEMIRTLPKHKGTENVLAQLRKRLSRLKAQKTTKASAKPKYIIKKEGAAQICLIGLTQSGKSTLINALTNAQTKVGEHTYTTKQPVVGMLDYGDLQLQLIELPSKFHSEVIGLLHGCDLIVILLDSTKNEDQQLKELTSILSHNKLEHKKSIIVRNKATFCGPDSVCIDAKSGLGLDELKEKIWQNLNLIRVYTKSPGRERDLPAIALHRGSTVREVAKQIHKDFLKTFKFARVFNNTKFSGQKVGLEYRLSDGDVLEIHTA